VLVYIQKHMINIKCGTITVHLCTFFLLVWYKKYLIITTTCFFCHLPLWEFFEVPYIDF